MSIQYLLDSGFGYDSFISLVPMHDSVALIQQIISPIYPTTLNEAIDRVGLSETYRSIGNLVHVCIFRHQRVEVGCEGVVLLNYEH